MQYHIFRKILAAIWCWTFFMSSTAELDKPESIAPLNEPAVTEQIPLCEFYIWEKN